MDNIKVVPQNADFTPVPHEISCATGGTSTFYLNAGPAMANKDYVIFSNVTGPYPGFNQTGVYVPLNLDTWTWSAFSLMTLWPGFMGTLDANGQATANFNTFAPLPPEAIALAMYFDYWVLKQPGKLALEMASHPMFIFYLP